MDTLKGLSFNRTSMESKLYTSRETAAWVWLLIEPVWNRNRLGLGGGGGSGGAFNRTSMESKHSIEG